MKITTGQKAFNVFNIIFLIGISMTIILPMMHIISVSLSDKWSVTSLSVGIFPKGFRLDAYIEIVKKGLFIRSMINTVLITVVTVVLSLVVNIMAAYGFSKKFFLKKALSYYFVLTMYFSGGLVPTFLLIGKYLQLYNSYLAYILPVLANFFYIIIIRSQIEAIPPSLPEAATVDGANTSQVLIHIIIPVLLPTIAAIGMFIALAQWNMWYSVLLYTNKEEMWTLQYYLRAVVFEKILENDIMNINAMRQSLEDQVMPENFQMAAIVLVALPIVLVYPFIQKYFVKGIFVGSVKG